MIAAIASPNIALLFLAILVSLALRFELDRVRNLAFETLQNLAFLLLYSVRGFGLEVPRSILQRFLGLLGDLIGFLLQLLANLSLDLAERLLDLVSNTQGVPPRCRSLEQLIGT